MEVRRTLGEKGASLLVGNRHFTSNTSRARAKRSMSPRALQSLQVCFLLKMQTGLGGGKEIG